MGYEVYADITLVSGPTLETMIAIDAELTVEPPGMMLISGGGIEIEQAPEATWTYQGWSMDADDVKAMLRPVADRFQATIRIEYRDDLGDEDGTYYVGPGAAQEVAADLVHAISQRMDELVELIRSNQVGILTVLDMFDGTGIQRDAIDLLLTDYNKESESSDSQ